MYMYICVCSSYSFGHISVGVLGATIVVCLTLSASQNVFIIWSPQLLPCSPFCLAFFLLQPYPPLKPPRKTGDKGPSLRCFSPRGHPGVPG